MLLPTTEIQPDGETIDALSVDQAATHVLHGQRQAVDCVNAAAPEIGMGAVAMADAIRAERSLIYAAAGSSGLMALADACELPGTFGIPESQIQIHMAGGVPTAGHMPGNTEDETEDAKVIASGLESGDVAIVLSASGTTPYALAVAQAAKKKGGTVIAIANNPGTELLRLADIPICLKTPPEVIAGSTRMGAGTAQKVALNLMSSMMGVNLGHVYRGLMVNVVVDNAKLVKRATGIVAQIANVSERDAKAALDQAGLDTKVAILLASGCSLGAATDLLETHKGHLDPCIQSLKQTKT